MSELGAGLNNCAICIVFRLNVINIDSLVTCKSFACQSLDKFNPHSSLPFAFN